MEKSKINKEWNETSYTTLENVGSAKNLSIIPLIEYNTVNDQLTGEQGVSYLITVDDKKILFDFGLNQASTQPSALLKNMSHLGLSLSDIDYMFLSHKHIDHVGGGEAVQNNTISTGGQDALIKGKTLYTPDALIHNEAVVEVITEPQILSPGVVSSGGISETYWLAGTITEQSLAINVEGKGIVLIVGCGHHTIEKLIKRTKELFDEPIYAIIGGLHYPVTDFRSGSSVERYLARVSASGKQPWHGPLTKSHVEETIALLQEENLGVIALSPHDSCDWTINTFKRELSDIYEELAVGREIIINS